MLTLAVVPVEDILCGVEIALRALPKEPPRKRFLRKMSGS
jgi:hypothetical protein